MEITEKRGGLEAASTQKGKAIELAVQAIEKQFGKGSIMRLGANEALVSEDIAAIPTGSMSLDIMVQKLQEKRLSLCMPLPKLKNRVESLPLLTPSMRWMCNMLEN
jgi:hypothetical protein